MRSRRWLTLGIGVKRYLLLIFLGTVVLALAMAMFLAFVYRTIDIPGPAGTVVYYVTLQFLAHPVRELTVGALGLVIAASGAFLLGRSVLSVVVDPKDDLAEILYQNRRLQRGPRVVAIGGGTGLGVLLRGLKGYTNNITAVVTVADDGGSSGRLREELGLMPPGDIRQCLAALADSESLMQDVMEYRFSRGQGLQGHSLGNLLIAAMTDLNQGNFERGVNDLSGVLRIRGRIRRFRVADAGRHGIPLQPRSGVAGAQSGEPADSRHDRSEPGQLRARRQRFERGASDTRAHPAVHPDRCAIGGPDDRWVHRARRIAHSLRRQADSPGPDRAPLCGGQRGSG
ncbi:MAG: YvcK family protein [Chloroflexi bacterium]|nr:YvcK family protein [Chloroflexota bacterium]